MAVKARNILICGGAGYIGSSIAALLADRGHTPIILDSLVTGRRELVADYPFYHGDIADGALWDEITAAHDVAVVIHCAALIVVPDSLAAPARYYHENVVKSLYLIQHMRRCGLERILFSSSASVYGVGDRFVVTEQSPCQPQSPYARTKLMVEYLLEDIARASELRAISLRYFNPIGADPQLRSGAIIPRPTHVLGKMLDAAQGHIPAFEITGTAYPTRDGSGMRDFIHVADLARAHVHAVERFDAVVPAGGAETPFTVINVGTGTGTTVKELLAACQRAVNVRFPVVEAPPRPGDVAGVYANCERAQQLLGWRPQYSIAEAIQHHNSWLEKRTQLLGY